MKLGKCLIGLVILAGSAGSASASTLIDLRGSTSGSEFWDFDAVSGSAPIEVGSTQTLTITAAATGGNGVGFVNSTATSLGVNTQGTSADAGTDDLEEAFGETLTFVFNFDGSITGIDLTGVSVGERLTITNLDSTDSVRLVDGAATPVGGDVLLGGLDAITTLDLIFNAGDSLRFSVDGSVSPGAQIGLQTITVIPTPSTAVALMLAGGGLFARRRRA